MSGKALQRTATAVQPAPAAARASWIARLFLQEDLNFLVTNRLPRRWATLFMGWFSRIESPTLTRIAIAIWRRFAADLDLGEAKTQHFRSLRDCFVRELRDGARPIDAAPETFVSPCDAIVGAVGRVRNATAIQAKGFPYGLMDLLGDAELVAKHRDGMFVTLRLKSSFYHRFHAPCDGSLRAVRYVSGDTWNVNPIALRRVERLFCKNERAILDLELPAADQALTLVAVAAILVASIRVHGLPELLDLRYRGAHLIPCARHFHKGEELGWFEQGSTILLFASGELELCDGIVDGSTIRMGEPLLRSTRIQDPATVIREDRSR